VTDEAGTEPPSAVRDLDSRHTTYPVDDGGQEMIPLAQMPQLHPDAVAIDARVELSDTRVNRGVLLEYGRLVGIVSAAERGGHWKSGPHDRLGRRRVPVASEGKIEAETERAHRAVVCSR